MRRLFRTGDKVLARIDGFDPFPAVVEGVRLNEIDCSIFYYVRLQGSLKIVPLDAENIDLLEGNKKFKTSKYTDKDLKRESKQRVDSLLGAEDEIPEVLMNFVTVDSDFEEVSEEAVKNLGLYSIKLTPSMVQRLDNGMSTSKNEPETEDDDYVDVEDLKPGDSLLRLKSYSCPTCSSSFKTSRALNIHRKCKVLCRKSVSILKSNSQQFNNKGKKSSSLPDVKNKKTSDRSDKVNELIGQGKRNWTSKSASGFYPCKLCFRKFRSKGEAQLHMSSHIAQATEDTVRASSPESGDSDDDEGSRSLHNSSERNRRAEMAMKFSELADAMGVVNDKPSKVRILEMAKNLIESLEKESEQQDHELIFLQEQNSELRGKFADLDTKQFRS